MQNRSQLVMRFASMISNLAQAIEEENGGEQDRNGSSGSSDGWIRIEQEKDPRDGVRDRKSHVLQNGNWAHVDTRGNTRIENAQSGVIYEELPEGTALLSLPDGRFIQQTFQGEPWLLHDPNGRGGPRQVRTGRVKLPGEDRARFVYSFRDGRATHVIDAQTLQYYVARYDSAE
ncbi:MAG: hypothetical protein HY319_18100 [Armatimonadetes bacterium]|nr:hypothetical protein [Armatimonadota bacterium]